MVIPKTASGIFNATNIDYILHNLGVERLVVFGVYSHQCVESTVRDAADRGYLVTLVADACSAKTAEQDATTAAAMKAYGRIAATDGRLIYFHRNSVLGDGFDNLAEGDAVEFAMHPGEGEHGPQASSVKPIGSMKYDPAPR